MNLRIISCILLTISCVSLITSPVFSKDNIIRVEVMGSATATIDTKKPDDLAIDDAFRKAVAKAVETIISKSKEDSYTLLLDDKFYSVASRYISNYRILLKETMEDDISTAEGGVSIYNVSMEADVSVDQLKKDLIAAGIINEEEVKNILITLLNLKNYKGFEFFRNNILKADGVKAIHYNSFVRDKIEMTIETSRDVHALKQEIMSIGMKDWKIEVDIISGWISPDRIEVNFFQNHK